MSTTSDSDRLVSDDPKERSGDSGTVRLTSLGVAVIGLFQKQAELTDRLWTYFASVSLTGVLVALVGAVLAQQDLLPARTFLLGFLLVMLVVAYLFFSAGNRKALVTAQEVLVTLAGQARAQSGVELRRPSSPKAAKFFHVVVTLLVAVIMSVGFWIAYSPPGP